MACANQTYGLTNSREDNIIGHQKLSLLLSACFPLSVAKSAKISLILKEYPYSLASLKRIQYRQNTNKLVYSACSCVPDHIEIYKSARFCMRRGEILSEKGSLILLRSTKYGHSAELKLGHISEGESPLTTEHSSPAPFPPKKTNN